MFSIKRRFTTVMTKIDGLIKLMEHPAEENTRVDPSIVFLTIVFLIEKLIRRTLIHLVVSQGNTTELGEEFVRSKNGLDTLNGLWKRFDPNGLTLKLVIGDESYKEVKEALKLRNDLVHGSGHEFEGVYEDRIPKLLNVIKIVKREFTAKYRYFGWTG